MKQSQIWYALALSLLLFVWYRKPAGRSSSDPGESHTKIKGLKEFDAANPNASKTLRQTFYGAVQAHLGDDLASARRGYQAVLDEKPNEPTTLYNLTLL
jgi:hypothetical protein